MSEQLLAYNCGLHLLCTCSLVPLHTTLFSVLDLHILTGTCTTPYVYDTGNNCKEIFSVFRNLISYQKPDSPYFAQDLIPHSQATLREVLSPAQMSFVLRKSCNVRAINKVETFHGQGVGLGRYGSHHSQGLKPDRTVSSFILTC